MRYVSIYYHCNGCNRSIELGVELGVDKLPDGWLVTEYYGKERHYCPTCNKRGTFQGKVVRGWTPEMLEELKNPCGLIGEPPKKKANE